MHLIDDIDFELSSDRGEPNVVPQFPDLIDAVITGSIDLEDIQTDSLRDFIAGIADTTRVHSRSLHAVECLRQDTSC
jgi:hypothetical protein